MTFDGSHDQSQPFPLRGYIIMPVKVVDRSGQFVSHIVISFKLCILLSEAPLPPIVTGKRGKLLFGGAYRCDTISTSKLVNYEFSPATPVTTKRLRISSATFKLTRNKKDHREAP